MPCSQGSQGIIFFYARKMDAGGSGALSTLCGDVAALAERGEW
jgi:hypothetical protein